MTKPITDRPLAKPGAKPAPYDQGVAEEVCVRLMEGRTLRSICEDQDIPSKNVVYRWLAADPVFKDAYARAREFQMLAWADDVVEIADDTSADYYDRDTKDGGTERVVDQEAIARSRLKVDARKWLMSKLSPRLFADKVEVDLHATVKVEDMSDEELEAKTRAAFARLGVAVPAHLLLGHHPSPSPISGGGADGDDDEGGT